MALRYGYSVMRNGQEVEFVDIDGRPSPRTEARFLASEFGGEVILHCGHLGSFVQDFSDDEEMGRIMESGIACDDCGGEATHHVGGWNLCPDHAAEMVEA